MPLHRALARLEAGALRAAPDTLRGQTVLEHAWEGVSLLQVRAEQQEHPPGTLLQHLVVLNLGDEIACGASVEGSAWRPYRFPHQAVTVVPAGVLHAHAAHRPSPHDVMFVEIAPALGDEVLRAVAPRSRIRPVFGERDPFAAHVLLALLEEARAAGPHGRVGARALATALAADLARESPAPEPPRVVDLPSARLRRVLEHIAGHLDMPLTLQQLAEVAGIDLFRFVRAFKQSTGVSPHRYVLEARIARAKELLRDGDLSITDVALSTGFATPSHFSVTFRRRTGMTPRAFRIGWPGAPDGGETR